MGLLDGLLFLVLLVWTYIHNRYIPFWEVGTVLIKATDVGVFVIFAACLIALVLKRCRTYEYTGRLAAVRYLGLLTFLYAAITMTWSQKEFRDQLAMGYTLLCAITCILSALFIVDRQVTRLVRLLWCLSVFLAVAGVCYWLQAVFDLGLRAVNYVELDQFGTQRLGGPLVNPARGQFMFVPALGFVVGQLLSRNISKKTGVPVAMGLLVSLFGLGARSALVCLAVFVSMLAVSLRRSNRTMAIILVVVFSAGAGSLVFLRSKTERLSTFDPGRLMTYETSIAMFLDQSPLEHVFGAGYGRWWPWYRTDVEGGGAWFTHRFVQMTPYGPTLFNPHSTFIIAVIELGLPGSLAFAFLLLLLIRTAWRCRHLSPNVGVFATGVAATIPAFFSDCYLVSDVKQNLIWWLFVGGAVALQRAEEFRLEQNYRASYGRELYANCIYQEGRLRVP